MRKLLWSGVAALIVGAAAVYVVTDHAAKNPTSVLGRCATAAATFGLTGNPVEAVRNLHGAPCDSGHVGELAKPGDEKEVLPPVADDNDFPPVHEAEEIINVEVPNNLEEEFGIEIGSQPHVFDNRTPPGTVNEQGFVEEYSDFTMPVPFEELPVMPEVIEEDCVSGIVGDILQMVRSCAQEAVAPLPVCEEPYPLQMCVPLDVEEGTRAVVHKPWSFEDVLPVPFQNVIRFMRGQALPADAEEVCEPAEKPAANWLFRLLGCERLFEEPAAEPMTEIESMPAGEETPARDPNYHRYHYQGCPYSGCPYPHAYTPPPSCMPPAVAPPVVTPAPEAKLPVKKKKKPLCGTGRVSFWRSMVSGGQEPCGPANVDTMECRPTDIHLDLRMPRHPF